MLQSVRAIYKDGQLHPLDPIQLDDGQTVNITITTEENLDLATMDTRLRAAGVLMEIEVPPDAEELTPEERLRIGKLFIGDRPAEAIIDEERGSY